MDMLEGTDDSLQKIVASVGRWAYSTTAKRVAVRKESVDTSAHTPATTTTK